MKILLDEMYTGHKEILESMGYEVVTVPEVGLNSKRDVDVVRFAKENNLVLVTQDSLPAEIAEVNQVGYILVRSNDIASVIDQKLKKLMPG